jgi:hypothetical protein
VTGRAIDVGVHIGLVGFGVNPDALPWLHRGHGPPSARPFGEGFGLLWRLRQRYKLIFVGVAG